jgi:hypothetical protein
MGAEDLSTERANVLAHLAEAIQWLGYATRLVQGDELGSLPGPILLTTLSPDAQGRARQANWMFLPLEMGEEFAYLSLIHYYAELPFALPAEARARVAALILTLNNQVPIGHLGISESGALYHRYVIASEKWQRSDPRTLRQLQAALEYVQDTFAPLLEAEIGG